MKSRIILFINFLFIILSCHKNEKCNFLSLNNKNSQLINLIEKNIILGYIYEDTEKKKFFSIEGISKNSIHINTILYIELIGDSYIILFESELMSISGIKQGVIIYNKNNHNLTFSMIASEIIKVRLCIEKYPNNLYLDVEYKLKQSFMNEIIENKVYEIKDNLLILPSNKTF